MHSYPLEGTSVYQCKWNDLNRLGDDYYQMILTFHYC